MLVIGLVASLTSLAISASMDTILGMWVAIVPTALLNHNWSVLKARYAATAVRIMLLLLCFSYYASPCYASPGLTGLTVTHHRAQGALR